MHEWARSGTRITEINKENPASRLQKKYHPFSSSVDRILYLQKTIGNQAVAKLIESGALQAKFSINPFQPHFVDIGGITEEVGSAACNTNTRKIEIQIDYNKISTCMQVRI